MKDMMYCGGCGEPCDMIEVDKGIGPYEYWGTPGRDVNKCWVSDCCEETVYENRDLTIESDDYPDPEADRADEMYNDRRAGN